MGSILENRIRYKKALDIMKDVEYIVNDSLGFEVMTVDGLDGKGDEPTSLIITDVVSFTTFNALEKKAFIDALEFADAVNFFTRNDDMVRITMSFMNTHEIKGIKTEIRYLKRKASD